MMGGRGDGLITKTTSAITINIFSSIVKIIVDDLLRPSSTFCTINPIIYSLIFSYTQQSTMFTCFMWGIVAGLGPISTFPITNNSLYHIAGVKVAGIFRPRSTSTIINYYIPPQVFIIATSIYPTIIIIIIIMDIILLFLMNLSLYTKKINV